MELSFWAVALKDMMKAITVNRQFVNMFLFKSFILLYFAEHYSVIYDYCGILMNIPRYGGAVFNPELTNCKYRYKNRNMQWKI